MSAAIQPSRNFSTGTQTKNFFIWKMQNDVRFFPAIIGFHMQMRLHPNADTITSATDGQNVTMTSNQGIEIVAKMSKLWLELEKRAHTPSDNTAACNSNPNFCLLDGSNRHTSTAIGGCVAEQKSARIRIPHSHITIVISHH
jgi:hypothetical protein